MRRPHLAHLWLLSLLLIGSIATFTFAQEQSQYDKGTPPQHAAGVSPLGSYTSTELGSVNLSNGALNFKIPLATVGGRGFSIPLTLNYSSKVWSASMDTAVDNNNQQFSAAYADYANLDGFVDFFERVGPGWTIGAAPTIFNRIVRINQLPPPPGSPSPGCYTFTVPKLTVMLPDKGEIEFRDDAYDGAPLPSDCGGWVGSNSRGKRWHATDGSGTIYISDIDNAGAQRFGDLSGVVITADGTRYKFSGPRCTAITDRNGNRINIDYTNQPSKIEYKDQMGRITKVEQFVADPDNPSVTLAVLVTIPGYTGNHYIKIKRDVMSANYRSDITPPSAVCNGTYDPFSKGYWSWCGSSPTILFPHSYGAFLQRIDTQQVLTEVVLPDQRSLHFKYNVYGEVAEAQLPTGGKLWYDFDYQSVPVGNSPLWEIGAAFHTEVEEVDRALVQRRAFDGSTLQTTWNYSYTGNDALVVAISPTEGVLLNERHLFMPSGRYTDYIGGTGAHDGTQYSLWSTGIESRTEMRNADGTAVLSAIEKDWKQRATVSWTTGYAQEQPAKDNRVNQERHYLETGMMAKVETVYDQYNNPIEVKEYDYDQTTVKRRTVTSYYNGPNYQTDDSIHLLRLPEIQTIYEGSAQKAQTVTEYAVYTDDLNHYLLTDYSSVSQHDSSYGALKVTRGNPTRIGTWLNTTGSFIYTYPRYDVLGNVVSMKDARGNVSTISFADDFGNGSNPGSHTQNPATPTYALPTLITSPPPLPGQPAHIARSQYDYSTGLLTGFRDRNNVVTQTIYNDPFDRPTLIKSALGLSGIESHTKMYYAPATSFGITLANNDVLTAKDQTTLDDANLRSWIVTDGFGRTTQAWTRDPQGDVKVVTIYDALSRTKQVSNPFRPSLGETAAYSTTTYDLLGRVTAVTGVDGSVVSTAYSGNSVTVTDQASKKRKSVTDALGRLTQVREAPDVPGFDFLTTYQYDALDNLVTVTQGSQTRSFTYNSLKQLISASNPENGTVEYQYDDAGNLLVKKDAREVSTHFAYDAFNRVTRRWYNGSISTSATTHNLPELPASVGASNEANFFYDAQALPSGAPSFSRGAANGRLVAVTYGTNSNTGDYLGYDAAGRNVLKIQRTGNTDYPLTSTLNIAGVPTTVVYPSGRLVSYTYDVAGRTSSVIGNLGDGTSRNYATSLNYSPFGGLTREQFGTNTPLYHKTFYNIRGQLFDTRLSSVNDVWDWNRGRLIFYYSSNHQWGQSGTDNNGNVMFAENWIPPENATLDQFYSVTEDSYSYDALNRLSSVQEQLKIGSGQWQSQFRQAYDYDQYGNRTIKPFPDTNGTGINNKQFERNVGNKNQLGVPSGQAGVMIYDTAGNLTTDTYTGAGGRTYDAENKMTSARGGNNQDQSYMYDANGHRIKRRVDGVETWQVYGFGGELLAEYGANAPASNPQKEYAYRNGELLITAEPSPLSSLSGVNVAAAANGAVASASSTVSTYVAGNAINGDHVGINANRWADDTVNAYPDWIQVDFAGAKIISEIDVYGLQQNWTNPVEPTLAMISSYALTDFEVRYWNGSDWATVPGASITGNNKVWRRFTFAPLTTTKIQVRITNVTGDNRSQIVEIEAYTSANVGSAANGASASASSALSSFAASNAINGDHVGISGNRWADNTVNAYPDWIQMDFAGSKTIGEIDIYGLQQNWTNPVEPTLTMTSSYALTDFQVQYWNGCDWAMVPGGNVTGNNKVWRKFTFAPLSTNKIRVYVTAVAGDNRSQLVEIEAYTTPEARIQWLVTDHLGTPRMIVDQTGALASIKRHDYLPFGEELFTGTGGRTSALGYSCGDTTRQQFTSKERDVETGLDYFEARYYASVQGRFTSADPFTVTPARVIDPQQLNLYTYVRNNPLVHIDPTGMIIDTSRLSEDQLKRWQNVVELAIQKDDQGNYVNPKLHEQYERLNNDERTFFIENKDFGSNDQTIGNFEITKFKGNNDFSEAVIQLDFKKIKRLVTPVAADEVSGFKKFEGLFGVKNAAILRLAELFGHEGAHAVFGLDNVSEAVKLQQQLNDRDAAFNALPKKGRYPLPPDITQKQEAAMKALIPTERYAQQVEKIINGELRATSKRKN
ncbi:MAG TPA: RHS repeat-associated core domain-containing protein [Pyrinomonadaceae bacterium]